MKHVKHINEAWEKDSERNKKERMWDYGNYEKKKEWLTTKNEERGWAGYYYFKLPLRIQELIQTDFNLDDKDISNTSTCYLSKLASQKGW